LKRFAPFLAAAALAAHGVRGEELPLWEVGIGVAGISFPDYRGSSNQRTYVLPVPMFAYRGDYLQADRERFRGVLFRSERFDVDLSLNASVPVSSDDDTVRAGMPDLDPTLEVGPTANIRLTHTSRYTLRLRLPVRAVIATDLRSVDGAGVVANPNLNLDVRLDGGWKLGFVAGALFADRRNHGYFYDVAPEFARPDRPAYDAPGGYSGAQFIVTLSKRFGPWFVGGFVKHDLLNGAAFEASPLVERSSNVAAGIAVTWAFARSEKRVVVRD